MTPAAAVATLGGLGHAVRGAPGTIASVVALLFAWGLGNAWGPYAVIAAAVAASAVGFWAAEHYVRECTSSDPSECVIDEIAGQFLACAFAPRTVLAYTLAFVFFRTLDILKPWPIGAAERLPGGVGIMADDLVAGLLSGLAVMLLAQLHVIGA